VVVGLAACSSSSSTTTTTTTTTAATTTTTTTTTTVALPSTAASLSAIKSSYSVLFNLANPELAPKLAVVQGATTIKAAMEGALKSVIAKEAGGASVASAKIEQGTACTSQSLTSPCAKVSYEILTPKGTVLMPSSVGYAVYQSDKWLVAKTTICTLLGLENAGKAPAGC